MSMSQRSSNSKSKSAPFMHATGLRKGKWTVCFMIIHLLTVKISSCQVEEENYANKIIQSFCIGTLRLDSDQKNVTLRSYLAEQLDCDPMRITKKYAGDSCLGKRVYREDQLSEEDFGLIESDRIELEELEHSFRERLGQSPTKRLQGSRTCSRASDSQPTRRESATPAIDALIRQRRLAAGQEFTFPSTMASPDPAASLAEQKLAHEQYLRQLKREAAMVLLNHEYLTQQAAGAEDLVAAPSKTMSTVSPVKREHGVAVESDATSSAPASNAAASSSSATSDSE